MTPYENVAAAFSRKALVYDEFGRDHPNLQRMRERVYGAVLEHTQPPARILELNAGTGADAAYLAAQGFHVHATDLAPGMVAQIRQKIERLGLADRLTAQQCSFTDLAAVEGGPYDAVFSNFGGLNCVPGPALVARGLPRLLRPGAVVTAVVMPPFCPWDAAAALRGDWRTATRRWHRGGTTANVEGVRFTTYYFTPRQVRGAFGPDFRMRRLEGLSIFAPPADRKQFAHRFPRLYRALASLDERLCFRWPFRAWGDFFIISLRYEPRAAR